MAPDVTSPAASAAAGANGGTTELDALRPELKRYERVLAQLSGEPTTTGKKRGRPKGTGHYTKGKGIGDERLEAIRQAVLHYARDHDEFAQVDIRAFAGDGVTGGGSGIMTMAFEKLRQEGTIRFARQEGNRKMFRLTRQAAREVDSA